MSTSCLRKSSFPGNARSRSTVSLVCALRAFNSITPLVLHEHFGHLGGLTYSGDFVLATLCRADARAIGSHRVDGYSIHGKGSHYVGGH